MRAALLLVDIQNDFLPGGALGVADGDLVVDVANELIPRFSIVAASQDWHPKGHVSFEQWPQHCVEGSVGAQLSSRLELPQDVYVVRKAQEIDRDAFSAFDGTPLGPYLRERGAERVVLMGLTTEYCVKYSALDSVRLGFETVVVVDGCRPVAQEEGDLALKEMKQAGVVLRTLSEVSA